MVSLKKLVVPLLKIGVSVGILAYLIVQAQSNAVFSDLVERPKRWDLLGAAAGAFLAAVAITFVRWYYLVRALGLELSLHETLRLSFLGFLFNLAPMGIVGGDLLRAVMLARRQTSHRAEALVTVFVDRAIGLYVLFLVALAAVYGTGMWHLAVPSVQIACNAVLVLAIAGTVAVVVPLGPDLTRGKSTELAGRIPYVGPPLKKVIVALRMYRFKLPTLLGCSLMTVAVHSLFALVVYWIAAGLYDAPHELGTHFVVVPVSAATSVLPISLGPFEAVLDILYADIPLPDGAHMARGQGLVVALGYRVINVLIAAIGLGYYLASRREVAAVMHEAEAEEG